MSFSVSFHHGWLRLRHLRGTLVWLGDWRTAVPAESSRGRARLSVISWTPNNASPDTEAVLFNEHQALFIKKILQIMNPPSKLSFYLDSLSSSRPLTQQTSQHWLSGSAKTPRIDWQCVLLISSVLVVHNRRQRFCWAAATLYLRFSGAAGAELSVWSSRPQGGAFKRLFVFFWKDIHGAKGLEDQMFLRRHDSWCGGNFRRSRFGRLHLGCAGSHRSSIITLIFLLTVSR